MAQPVWVLSVDLQTKTATFTTGLADAAKAARGSFQDIKGGASEMGGAVSYSTMEARHSVMMLGEEFGVHLPRSLTSFIAGLGPIGPALEAAFPFLAIALGATLLIEHLVKMQEAGEKLTEDQVKFGTAVNNAWGQLDQKLLQAQIRSDELRNDHLGALRLQLELIDKQGMGELVHSFEEVAKAADVVMKELEGHWYTWGKGSEGAKHALDAFQAEYNSLLSQGKGDEASGLLRGTAEQAQKVLGLLQQLQTSGRGMNPLGAFADPAKWHAAEDALNAMGIAHGQTVEKEIEAQQNLVSALNAQIGSEERISAIKKLDKGNATTATHNEMDKEAEAAARKKAEEQDKLDREYLQNFKHEQQNIINATREGTADRLDALQSAMDSTAELYGKDNETYKQYAAEYIRTYDDLSKRTLESVGRELDEEQRLKDAAIKEQVQADQRAAAEKARHLGAMSRPAQSAGTDTDELQRQQAVMNAEYALKEQELQKELAANKQADNAQIQEAKRTQDALNSLRGERADRDQEFYQQEQQANKNYWADYANTAAQSMARVAEGKESLSRLGMILADQALSKTLAAMIQEIAGNKTLQLSHAEAAAAGAYKAMSGIPLIGPELGAISAAAVFAGAMAFESGGIVPGVGRGDVVPSMLTPGEGIVPGGVMDGLRNVARNGGFEGGRSITVHVRPTYHVNTIDGDGMQATLEKHTDQLQRHFENVMRKTNR